LIVVVNVESWGRPKEMILRKAKAKGWFSFGGRFSYSWEEIEKLVEIKFVLGELVEANFL